MIKRHSGSNSSVFWGYLRSLSDMKKVRRGNHNSIFRQIIFNSEQNYFTTELISWNFVTKIVAVISTSQCGNFIIFLSLRFYVKSIFENQEVLKMPFSQFLGLWKCKKYKFRGSKCVQTGVFGLPKSLTLISRKIWGTEKSAISTSTVWKNEKFSLT